MYRKTGSPQLQKLSNSNGLKDMQPNHLQLDMFKIKQPDRENVVIDVQLLTSDDPSSLENFCNTTQFTRVENAYDNDAFDGELKNITTPEKNVTSEERNYTESQNTGAIRTFRQMADSVKSWGKSHSRKIRYILQVSAFFLYNIYLGFAVSLSWTKTSSYCEGIKFLTLVTAVVYFWAFYKRFAKPYILSPLQSPWASFATCVSKTKHIDKIGWILVWMAVIIFLVIDTQQNRYRLVSAAGLVVLIFLGYIFSAHPKQVLWRQVQWGVMAQIIFGLLILRWEVGYYVFQCLGNKVKAFLEFTDYGTAFVFGYLVTGELKEVPLQEGVFVFKVLYTIVFFSFLVSILYYYGILQKVVINVGYVLQCTIGTTACESMNAAANIFLGMTEAPLVIKPYLPVMTLSELHAVLTGGFATVAGSVMAAYISFGVNASHLLSASVMSAPAALAFSKLFYPETEESLTKAQNIKIEKHKETTVLDAASNAASSAMLLVTNVTANLISAMAFIAFSDHLINWFGSLIGWDFLSLQWLVSKAFIPISLIMGVEWNDKENVANLIGLKTIINEFVAYRKLSEFQKENVLSPRSEAIATFALCGFSNLASIGIQLGSLGSIVPERKSDLATIIVRAMVAGSAACFMTACVAGALLTVGE